MRQSGMFLVFCRQQPLDGNWWEEAVDQWSIIDPSFQWPDAVVIAMPSVVTDFFPSVVPYPLMYVSDQASIMCILDEFKSKSELYYYNATAQGRVNPRVQLTLEGFSLPELVRILRRRIDSSGMYPPITDIINR